MKLSLLKAALCASAAAIALAGAAHAQHAPGYTPPKTSWGVPDLQGTWSNASITDMQRSPEYPNLVMTADEVKKMEGEDYYNNRTREDAKPTDLTRVNAGMSQTGTRQGGTPRRVGPGDIIIIPAGTPHSFSELDEPISYLVFRFEPK